MKLFIFSDEKLTIARQMKIKIVLAWFVFIFFLEKSLITHTCNKLPVLSATHSNRESRPDVLLEKKKKKEIASSNNKVFLSWE